MNTYKNITMVQPTPNPEFDFNKILEVLIAVGGFLWATLAYMGKYFKDKESARLAAINAKKIETEEFIEKVAIACVKATVDSVLTDVKNDIVILFKYREEDRKHFDTKFDNVMAAIKK